MPLGFDRAVSAYRSFACFQIGNAKAIISFADAVDNVGQGEAMSADSRSSQMVSKAIYSWAGAIFIAIKLGQRERDFLSRQADGGINSWLFWESRNAR